MVPIANRQSPIDNPFLTADLPGTGGSIKQRNEDFLVEEQPLYEPAGEGEHLYLFVEKQGMTTADMVRRIAKAFRVSRRHVGFAGLKDKHAITRQHLSVHLPEAGSEEVGLRDMQHIPQVTLLWAERHANKLRRGHLSGNRFVIRIRDVEPTAVVRAKPILDRLAVSGAPNYFGPQRFGVRNNSQDTGRLFLLGEYQAMLDEMLGRSTDNESELLDECRALYRDGNLAEAMERWPRSMRYDRQALDAMVKGKPAHDVAMAIDHTQLDFLVCAFQSAVFNDVLANRLSDGTFDRLLPGDLAFKHDNRACFAVDEATAEQENAEDGRVPRMEVSPSGPMWGYDMTRAAGDVDKLELDALQANGLAPGQLDGRDGIPAKGSRRPLRIPVKDPDLSGGVDEHGPYIRIAFELPRGSFATTVLAEIMKSPAGDEA